MIPGSYAWVRGADGTLTVIDLPAPSDDDGAQLARTGGMALLTRAIVRS